MSFRKERYYTIIAQAKNLVPGFTEAFSQFEERVVLDRLSKSLITNYGRNVAYLALHFNRLPHEVTIKEINAYRYRKSKNLHTAEAPGLSVAEASVQHWLKSQLRCTTLRLSLICWQNVPFLIRLYQHF